MIIYLYFHIFTRKYRNTRLLYYHIFTRKYVIDVLILNKLKNNHHIVINYVFAVKEAFVCLYENLFILYVIIKNVSSEL